MGRELVRREIKPGLYARDKTHLSSNIEADRAGFLWRRSVEEE